MTLNSPYSGKPMRVVYEPAVWNMRGEKYQYTHIAFRDDESGEQYTTTESDAVCFEQVANQYREKHGIPYTDEILSLRERYGVSASKMSLILGFGANQYRLYEMGEVPSESNGKMIRSAMNPKVFLDLVNSSKNELTEKEYEKITKRVQDAIVASKEWKNERWNCRFLFMAERGRNNGYAPVSVTRIKNWLLYVLEQMGDTFQTKMNKVLFYIDFLSYRERGKAISGLSYLAIDFGPVPQRWDRVYSGFDEVIPKSQLVKEQECTILTSMVKADTSIFSAEELAIIDAVCTKTKKMSSRAMTAMSHEEPAWKDYVGKTETIQFSEAFRLVGV